MDCSQLCLKFLFFFVLFFCARRPFSVSGLSNCETWRSRWVIIHRMTINHAVSLKAGISLKRPGVMSWLSAWGLRGQLGAESQLEIRSSAGPSCIRVGWWRCKLDSADKEKCSDLMRENEGLQKQPTTNGFTSKQHIELMLSSAHSMIYIDFMLFIDKYDKYQWQFLSVGSSF